MKAKPPIRVAYFSMEFAIDSQIPNFAGGLGVLAQDILMSAADLGFPAVGISLVYHQDDDPKKGFRAEKFFEKCPETVEIRIEDRIVKIGAWKYEIRGKNGMVPIYFLTTNLEENARWDRDLTKNLYANDGYTRLAQEAILGIGGYRMLHELGYEEVDCYHMNEGHAAFLTLERLKRKSFHEGATREKCTFTTHTPVAAGHDYFDYHLANQVIPKMIPWNIHELAGNDRLGMTQLALALSRKSNSVAEKHREVCSVMFPETKFENVTNGIYHPRWIGEAMDKLFSEAFGADWKDEPERLKDAPTKLDDEKLLAAHAVQKKSLIDRINAEALVIEGPESDDLFDEKTLTIGFARRFVPYKRPDLIFSNLEKLREIGYRKIQIVFAGKIHDNDIFAQHARENIKIAARKLRGQVRVAMFPTYNLDIAKSLVTGVDIWLNNPVPPMEASGTSGMKASLNGGLNLSIADGWWIEGAERQPESGFVFGGVCDRTHPNERNECDAEDLYTKLSEALVSFANPKKWVAKMKAAIALLEFFNTHRVVREYEEKMWK